MRIVIAAPEAPDTFAHNVAFALRSMGHEVLTPRARECRGRIPLPAYHEARARLSRHYPMPAERWLVATVRAVRCDVVLALTQCLGEDALAAARKAGVRHLVAWWGDSPANMARWGLLSREWDLLFLKDPDGVAKLRRVGLDARLLHEAMCPAWHRPLAQCASDEVAVVGNWYAYRQFLVQQLLDAGVDVGIYGTPFPLWGLPSLRARHTNRYVVLEAKSRVFGRALACLNSSSIAEGNSLNCRAFEIAGAGGLHLSERKPIVSECFEPGKEVLLYDSVPEILEHLEFARRDPKAAQAIRDAAVRRAHAEHTYAHRLKHLLACVESA